MKSVVDKLRAARVRGVPLIAIRTADQPALLASIASNGTAVVCHDCVRGFTPANDAGIAAQNALIGDMDAAMFADVEVYPPNRATLFRGPVKIISGLTDCIADQHTTELLKTSFEQGELIALNNAGHLFPWTDADS